MPALYSNKGEKAKDLELPAVFHTPYWPHLIKRAVLAVESSRLQPMGKKPGSGRNNTAEYIGVRGKPTMYRTINVGRARLPRMRNRRGILYGKVASVPQARGGPMAHPPKVEAKREEYINAKERKKAIASAIAASVNRDMVKRRGHRFDENIFPLLVDHSFEALTKTKDVREALQALHVLEDVTHAKKQRKNRAGKMKNRGKPYKQKKSILIVVEGQPKIARAARNLAGVDVVSMRTLNAAHLAPGTHAGRLTIWTESALAGLMTKQGGA
ncbi:MAG: 50S ribosomal protein L4 [Candidatus Diapherotrites archaeon]|nr:50S ribosomal protein L4 [Candidatus Diapherotrites archaeon]MDZ4256631.1 50S ribosomal protein L4 [archaeon]